MWFFTRPSTSTKATEALGGQRKESRELERIHEPSDVDTTSLRLQLEGISAAVECHQKNKKALHLMDEALAAQLTDTVVSHGKRKMQEALECVLGTLGENDLTFPTCPVCKKLLTDEISTFSCCTHGLCPECTKSYNSTSCPVCRVKSQKIKRVRFV